MIISRAGLRVTFGGGGTDFEEYFRENGGLTIYATIKKYIYITFNKPFSDQILLRYSKSETVSDVCDIQHVLFKAIFEKLNFNGSVEIHSIADIPDSGCGLGSSSTFSVSLINGLSAFSAGAASNMESALLADLAINVEIGMLKEPIGWQDQIAAAFGGIGCISFGREGYSVEKFQLSKEFIDELEARTCLFPVSLGRSAKSVLSEQVKNVNSNRIDVHLNHVKSVALSTRDAFLAEDLGEIMRLMELNWKSKRNFASNVTNPTVDHYITNLEAKGFRGCRLVGAGGGGFILGIWSGSLAQLNHILAERKHERVAIDFEGPQTWEI